MDFASDSLVASEQVGVLPLASQKNMLPCSLAKVNVFCSMFFVQCVFVCCLICVYCVSVGVCLGFMLELLYPCMCVHQCVVIGCLLFHVVVCLVGLSVCFIKCIF